MVSWTHPEKAVSRLNSDALVTQLPSSSHGKEIETIKLPEEEISIQIKKIMAKGDKKASYVAYWNSSTEFYQIEVRMEEQEFIKLIKNIKF